MSKINTYVTRGKNIECVHEVKCLIKNTNNEIIFSTDNMIKINPLADWSFKKIV